VSTLDCYSHWHPKVVGRLGRRIRKFQRLLLEYKGEKWGMSAHQKTQSALVQIAPELIVPTRCLKRPQFLMKLNLRVVLLSDCSGFPMQHSDRVI
jgi:hypothetical protein